MGSILSDAVSPVTPELDHLFQGVYLFRNCGNLTPIHATTPLRPISEAWSLDTWPKALGFRFRRIRCSYHRCEDQSNTLQFMPAKKRGGMH